MVHDYDQQLLKPRQTMDERANEDRRSARIRKMEENRANFQAQLNILRESVTPIQKIASKLQRWVRFAGYTEDVINYLH